MATQEELLARPEVTGQEAETRFYAGSKPTWLRQTGYVLRRWPVIPIFILATFILVAIFAPLIAPHDPRTINLRGRAASPFWDDAYYEANPKVGFRYILGGDQQGRDVLSRAIHGARISLIIATISLAGGVFVGTSLGLVAGYFGGWTDEFISRTVDVWNALPFLLIAILAAITFGQSVTVVVVLLALAAWGGVVRNVRAEVLVLRSREYVDSSRVSGSSTTRILLRHMLPGVINTVLVLATLRVGGLILAEASLSFLGAGVPSSTVTWGVMVSEGKDWLENAWWMAVVPGLAILLVVMAINFLGDWLRDRFDPRLRQL